MEKLLSNTLVLAALLLLYSILNILTQNSLLEMQHIFLKQEWTEAKKEMIILINGNDFNGWTF